MKYLLAEEDATEALERAKGVEDDDDDDDDDDEQTQLKVTVLLSVAKGTNIGDLRRQVREQIDEIGVVNEIEEIEVDKVEEE